MANDGGTFDSALAQGVSLETILSIFKHLGTQKIYVKKLAPNDNSKNQPYFGPHLTDLSFLPTGEPIASASKSSKTSNPTRQVKYQTPLKLSWVDASGQIYDAPHSKLIYYPQYPEVRFSGFLKDSAVNASEWMDPYKQGRNEGRWLILGVCPDETIYAYLAVPTCNLSKELSETPFVKVSEIFRQIDTNQSASDASTIDQLKSKLLSIHQMGWIPSQKLNSDLTSSPYKAQNGGGYTLEAQLGVSPNGFSEPDFLGWEVKQFGVTKFPRTGAKPTTLMTPEPDGGIYVDQGVADFIKTYGYPDKSGKPDRLNFGGKHVAGSMAVATGLTLDILGFDKETADITDAEGCIALIDDAQIIAASWSFAKLMGHWKRKHSKAVYIPCLRRNTDSGEHEYHYGNEIELGVDTNFKLILSAMSQEFVYYDPGIKMENAPSDQPKIKRRSQFRTTHKNLQSLYKNFDIVNLTSH